MDSHTHFSEYITVFTERGKITAPSTRNNVLYVIGIYDKQFTEQQQNGKKNHLTIITKPRPPQEN